MNTEENQVQENVNPIEQKAPEPVEEPKEASPTPEPTEPVLDEATEEQPAQTEVKVEANQNVQNDQQVENQEESAPKEEEAKPEAETEVEVEVEDPNKIYLDLDDRNTPLCPKTKIQASNFFLADDSKFAVHCVLCTNEREEVRRMPQMNLSLSLVLNEKLAEQLFNEKEFMQGQWEKRIDDIVADFRSNFENECKSLKQMMMERLENESHEFMLQKIKSFLDKSREEYKADPSDFLKLQELCSTFNDFLLLKKSDEVASATNEVDSFKKIFDNMKRTLEVNFKYLKSKIKGQDESTANSRIAPSNQVSNTRIITPTPQPVLNESNQIHFTRQVETPVMNTAPVPVQQYNYSQQPPTRNNYQNQIINSQETGFFDNIPGNYSMGHQNERIQHNTNSYSLQNVNDREQVQEVRRVYNETTQNNRQPQDDREFIKRSENPKNQRHEQIMIQTGGGSNGEIPNRTNRFNANGVRIVRRSISSTNRPSYSRRVVEGQGNYAPINAVNDNNNKSPSFSVVDQQSPILRDTYEVNQKRGFN